MEDARRTRRPFEVECRLTRGDRPQWISFRGDPPESDGGSFGLHGVLIDITDRRAAQIALQESQERLNSIVQSAMDAIITVDERQRIVLFNSAAERLFQCPAAEATGTLIDRFIPPRSRGVHHSNIMAFHHTPEWGRQMGRSGSVSGLRADGQEFPIEASISKAQVGGEMLCTVILRDITERRRSETAIREREARFRTMADSAPVIIWIADPSGSSTYLNRRWFEFTGQTGTVGTGNDWIRSIHPDDRQTMTDSFRAAEELSEEQRRELRLLRADGTYRWVMATIVPLLDERRGLSGFIGSIVDITDLKQAQHTLRRSAEELERQVTERTAALSLSQQRLRALTRASTRTEEQERRRLAAELHDYLAQLLVVARLKLVQIERAVPGLRDQSLVTDTERILDEALTYTRSLVAELSPQVLYHLGLAAALRWLGEQMAKSHLQVHTVLPDRASLNLSDDVAINLFQAVRELLFNVVKHADSAEASISLTVEERTDLIIVVSDKGRGFDLKRLERPIGGSNSFGLLSVKERMESIGGSAVIESRSGSGTRVTLRYPLANESAPVAVDFERPAQPQHALPAHSASSRLRILLVDDHAMVREGIRALLERHATLQIVGEAPDGVRAVEMAADLHPHIVIMDANMPGMDGIEATREIKRRSPDIIVIGLSVQASSQVAEIMMAAGAAAYMTKESAGEQLYETISSLTASVADPSPGGPETPSPASPPRNPREER